MSIHLFRAVLNGNAAVVLASFFRLIVVNRLGIACRLNLKTFGSNIHFFDQIISNDFSAFLRQGKIIGIVPDIVRVARNQQTGFRLSHQIFHNALRYFCESIIDCG